jgi:6-phosphogluconolactonase (cycloisomerase 2 family)
MKILIALIALVVSAALAGPAAATTLFAPQYYAPGDMVRTFDVAGDGSLTQVGPIAEIGRPLPGAGGIGSIALAPDGNRAIAGFYFTGGAQGLSIGPTGAIAPAQGVVGAHDGMIVAVTPNGQFAYHAIFSATQGIDAYSMDANGALTTLPGSPFANAQTFLGLAIRPDGKFLYAGADSAIHRFAINANGSLTALPTLPFVGARRLQFSSDGARLIVSNDASQLTSLNVAADGSLSPAGPPITYGSTDGGYFSIHPNGRFVYITDFNGDALGGPYSINTYAIGADGALSSAGPVSIDPFRPRTVSVSPSGRFLYAGDNSASKILVSPIGGNGLPTGFRAVGGWTSGEGMPLVFRPEKAPTASFRSEVTSKPLTMTFDGAASTSPDGSVDGFSWSFGDGAAAFSSTPRTTYKFAKPGVYSVTLTADNAGCSTRSLYDGQTTSCVGSPGAASTVSVDTPPWITSLKVSPSKVTPKSKIKFKLTESASVSFYAQRPLPGRTVGTSCKKQTSKNKKAKKCTRWVRASKTFRKSGKGGKTTSFKFTGKVGKSKLKKGSYRFYATATDKAKNKGPAVTAKFKIKK